MGGLEGPPKPPKRSGRPGEAVAPLDARGPPTPPTLGSPRRSRGAPRRAGPPKPPKRSGRPGEAVAPLDARGPPTPQTFGAPGVNPGAPLPPPSIRRAGAVVPSRHEIDRLRDHRRVRALAARGPDRRRRPVGKPPPHRRDAARAAERRHLRPHAECGDGLGPARART